MYDDLICEEHERDYFDCELASAGVSGCGDEHFDFVITDLLLLFPLFSSISPTPSILPPLPIDPPPLLFVDADPAEELSLPGHRLFFDVTKNSMLSKVG